MTELPTKMKVRDDLAHEIANLPAEKKASIAYLQAGEAIELGPSADLTLADAFAVAFSFAPGWEPWSDPTSIAAPPCLLQIGSEALPAAKLRIGIRRELDGLILSSSETDDDGVLVKGDVRDGGILLVVLENRTATVTLGGHQDSGIDDYTIGFKPGNAGKGPGVMRFGSDAPVDEEAPFVGMLGPMVLFDVVPELKELQGSDMLFQLLRHMDTSALGMLAAEAERPIATKLAGTALVGERRFERNPRAIIWPDPNDLPRFVLEYSDTQPVQLDLPGKAREDHSLYSSTCLWCLIRMDDHLVLHGDSGQRFKLSYLGNNRFTGVSFGTNALGESDHTSSATFKLSADSAEIMVTPTDWANQDRKLFPMATFPKGASANMSGDALWPRAIRMTRVPKTYDLSRGTQTLQEQAQTFKDAFSKRLPLIGAFSRGWDVTKLDDPLNPINATGAQRDEEYYLFQQPADNSKYYRLETAIAAPYYCYTASLDTKQESKISRLYRSSSEYSSSESDSFGFSLGVGDTKLFDMSFEKSTTKTAKAGEEHAVVVSKSSEIKDKAMLDRRWLHLNKKFSEAVVEIAASADRASCFRLFEAFGTHYPNAMTFGIRAYSLGLIDGATMGSMLERGTDIKGSVGIPVDAAMIGLQGGQKTQSSKSVDAEVKNEMELGVTVGALDNPHPLMMDLRPITDLMQPPYLADSAVAKALPTIASYLDEYIKAGRKPLTSGYKMVQARLKSIQNVSPVYPANIVGRAFLVAVDARDAWSIKLPEQTKAKDSTARIWASTEKLDTPMFVENGPRCYQRLAPAAVHQPDRTLWKTATLSIPNSRTDLVPAIGWTAKVTFFYEAKIHERLDKSTIGWLQVIRLPASTKEMTDAEAKLSTDKGFEFFGTDWAQGLPQFYSNEFMSFTIAENRKLHIATSSKFTTVPIFTANLMAMFEARIVDPLDFFENADRYVLN